MSPVSNTPRWPQPRPWPDGTTQSSTHARVVLVADDNRARRHWVGAALRSVGYQVLECASGGELLDRLGSALMNRHETIEAVVTNPRMGGITGLQVLEGLERAHRTTPVVVMTAFAADRDDIRGRNHPRIEVLLEPFGADELITAVVRITLRRRHLDHAA